MVSSVQLAVPVYCGYTSTSVHLPVSQSSTAMGEGVSSNGPLQGSYREGRAPPDPTHTHKRLLFVTYAVDYL